MKKEGIHMLFNFFNHSVFFPGLIFSKNLPTYTANIIKIALSVRF